MDIFDFDLVCDYGGIPEIPMTDKQGCGCKVNVDSEFRLQKNSNSDSLIIYCPRHSPERVAKLEDALRKIIETAGDECTEIGFCGALSIAQEALRVDK